MRWNVLPIVAPIAAAGLSAWLIPASMWDGWRSGLLPALSVIAAAVLVRLARGLPFSNADHFELDDFRSVAKAFKKIARSLRILIFISLTDMLSIIFIKSVNDEQLKIHLNSACHDVISRSLSCLLAFGLAYAFVRVLQIVDSDVSLLKLQSQVIERAISKKNGNSFSSSIKDKAPNIAGIERFGSTR